MEDAAMQWSIRLQLFAAFVSAGCTMTSKGKKSGGGNNALNQQIASCDNQTRYECTEYRAAAPTLQNYKHHVGNLACPDALRIGIPSWWLPIDCYQW